MNFYLIIPIILGIITILQGSLNSKMGQEIGLMKALLIGNLLIVGISIALYFLVKMYPHSFPDFFYKESQGFKWQWWYFLPAVFGMGIVLGLPISFYKMNTVKVTITLIASQVIFSTGYDYFIHGETMHIKQWVGLVLSILGPILVLI